MSNSAQPPDQPTQPGGWGPPAQPSHQTTQPGGWGPPPGPPPAPKGSRTFSGRQVLALTLGVGAAALLLGIVIGAAGAGVYDTAGTKPRAAATTTQPPATATTEEPVTTEPASSYPEPKPSDFDLEVKVLKKENFGSAGSLVTFRIEAGWSTTYDPDKTYEVTYEVRGPEDGPMVNTFEVTGDEYRVEPEETASTPSASTRLTARATDVEEA
jgi:hypothetical protein